MRSELFVGPTGVGKTTTLAKLATRAAEPEAGLSVITTDALRIGADAVLRGLAREIGAGFQVSVSPAELERAVARDRARRVLVDTAGRSPADPHAVSDLLGCREAMGSETRVHLVLSAATKESDLRAEIERFRPLEPDGLVVTKLDESRDVVNVLNVLLEPDTPPLFWVSDGQRIPEDLHIPDPDELAGRVLGAAA